jgi:hypothetical protein
MADCHALTETSTQIFHQSARIPVDTSLAGSYMKPRGSGATPPTSIAQQGDPMKKKGKKDEKAPKKGK